MGHPLLVQLFQQQYTTTQQSWQDQRKFSCSALGLLPSLRWIFSVMLALRSLLHAEPSKVRKSYPQGSRMPFLSPSRRRCSSRRASAISSCCNTSSRSRTRMAVRRPAHLLFEYGDPKGYSAMAKLVGVPCGVAVKQVLDGTISEKGILAPMSSKINDPLMKELKKYGIELVEKVIA